MVDDTAEGHTALLRDFAAHVEAVEGLSPKTAKNYREAAAAFCDWLRHHHPDVSLAQLQLRHLTAHVVDQASRGLRPATRYGYVYGLKSWCRYLVHIGALDEDPAASLKPPRVPPHRVDLYSPAESRRILEFTETLPGADGLQTHAIIATLRYTGMRAGEVASLLAQRVDLQARRVEVFGKGHVHRLVVLPQPLADILDRFMTVARPQLADTPYVFVNPHCLVPDELRRFSVSALQTRTRLAGDGAGVPGRHYPHRWRHSFATELIRSGVALPTVQRLMGHRSIVSTISYTHLLDDDLRGAIDDVF